MTDVTNGGLRGDIFEMAETAGCRMIVREEDTLPLVNPKVQAMLEALEIDYLGVSLDALLIVAPASSAAEIIRVIRATGVNCREIGNVESGKPESVLVTEGKEHDFQPRFRESAYTPVKKVVDTEAGDFEEMKKGVVRASQAAIAKKERVLAQLRQKKKSA
jgi:hydrogenase expression/formation protein